MEQLKRDFKTLAKRVLARQFYNYVSSVQRREDAETLARVVLAYPHLPECNDTGCVADCAASGACCNTVANALMDQSPALGAERGDSERVGTHDQLTSDELKRLADAGVTYPWHPRQTLTWLEAPINEIDACVINTLRRTQTELDLLKEGIPKTQRWALHKRYVAVCRLNEANRELAEASTRIAQLERLFDKLAGLVEGVPTVTAEDTTSAVCAMVDRLKRPPPLNSKPGDPKPTFADVQRLADQPVREMWHPDYMDAALAEIKRLQGLIAQ